MQPTLLMLVDKFPDGFKDLIPAELWDSEEGYIEWVASLGHTPTRDDICKVMTDDEESKKWLKRRIVSMIDGVPTEEILGPEVPGNKGMFVYYNGA
jgi:hypothetical protein